MRPADEQLTHLAAILETTLPEGELAARLAEGRPLRVKLGIDPTAPDVHLGWAVVFDLLRRFQELGHVAVLIVGDFTARVGDPSLRSDTRKRLSAEEVDAYAERLLPVVRELLLPDNLEVRRNSEWLAPMTMEQVLDLTSMVTVARLMDREDFRNRWEANEPISLIEFMYPLLQGMDSVAVHADVEIGGSDQLWNLLVGRELQERHGQRPQVVATVPLLVGTDGSRKMSQSYGNYVSVRDEPEEMFGKVMSIPDHLMGQWYRLAGGATIAEVEALERGLAEGDVHPAAAKRELARRVVTRFWGAEAARRAKEAFDALFVRHETPAEVPEYPLPPGEELSLAVLLADAGLASSRSEARRLITQGAVRIDGQRVGEERVARRDLEGRTVKVGKRRFVRFV